MKDLYNSLSAARGISPVAARTDNTAIVSEINDRANGEGALFVGQIGANTDANATFTVLVEHGDAANLSDAAAVGDEHLLGTEAGASYTAADDDNKVFRIGYIGPKRYQRVTITPTGNDSGNIFIAGVWLQGGLRKGPAAQKA